MKKRKQKKVCRIISAKLESKGEIKHERIDDILIGLISGMVGSIVGVFMFILCLL